MTICYMPEATTPEQQYHYDRKRIALEASQREMVSNFNDTFGWMSETEWTSEEIEYIEYIEHIRTTTEKG